MTSSTLLTLVLVPVVYSYLDDLQRALGGPRPLGFLRWKRRGPEPVPVQASAALASNPGDGKGLHS